MNKKFVLSASLILLVGLAVFVSAEISQTAGGNYNVKVYLEKGWNLVYGVPMIQEDYPLSEGSTLAKEDLKAIYWYNPFGSEFTQVFPGNFQGFPELRDKYEYILGSASWVYSDKSGYFAYSQVDPISLQNKKLTAGWNFVGFSPEFKMKKISQIKGSCNFEKIAYWNSYRQNYVVFSAGESIDIEGNPTNFEDVILADSDSDIGKGVLIKSFNDCQLGSITPPTIPN